MRARRLELDFEMDARAECGIDHFDAVRVEKQIALVALRKSKEEGDTSLKLHIVGGTLGEEKVDLVKEKDGVPEHSAEECVAQYRLSNSDGVGQLSGANKVERLMGKLGHIFYKKHPTSQEHFEGAEKDLPAVQILCESGAPQRHGHTIALTYHP